MNNRLFVFIVVSFLSNLRCLSSHSHFSVPTSVSVVLSLSSFLAVPSSSRKKTSISDPLQGRECAGCHGNPSHMGGCASCREPLSCPSLLQWSMPRTRPSTCEAAVPTQDTIAPHAPVAPSQREEMGATDPPPPTEDDSVRQTPPPQLEDVSSGSDDDGGDDSGDGDDDVPTFEEFKHKKMIEQEAAKKTTPEPPVVPLAREKSNNYASMDCGAKMVGWSKDSQNPGAVLIENKDIYMLSPCSADIWFVIELCDLVAVHTLEVASFELFSSILKDFTVFSSERYPTVDWRPIGEFRASDVRTVQGFPLTETVYAKYIKVVMTSHFGEDYYCPISLVRVLGATIMEEFQEVESRQTPPPLNGDEASPLTATISNEENEGVEANGFHGDDDQQNQTFLGKAKDAVLSLLGHVNDLMSNGNKNGDGQKSSTVLDRIENQNQGMNTNSVDDWSHSSVSICQGDCIKREDTSDVAPKSDQADSSTKAQVVSDVIYQEDNSPIRSTDAGAKQPESTCLGDSLPQGGGEVQTKTTAVSPTLAEEDDPLRTTTGDSSGEKWEGTKGSVPADSGSTSQDPSLMTDTPTSEEVDSMEESRSMDVLSSDHRVAMETPLSSQMSITVNEKSLDGVEESTLKVEENSEGGGDSGDFDTDLYNNDVVTGDERKDEEPKTGVKGGGAVLVDGGMVQGVELNGGGMAQGVEHKQVGVAKGVELKGVDILQEVELSGGGVVKGAGLNGDVDKRADHILEEEAQATPVLPAKLVSSSVEDVQPSLSSLVTEVERGRPKEAFLSPVEPEKISTLEESGSSSRSTTSSGHAGALESEEWTNMQLHSVTENGNGTHVRNENGNDMRNGNGSHIGNGNGNQSGNYSDLNGYLAMGGVGKNQEKSVLIRLSNRVRDLEDNISLFSSYLDQLSTGMKKNRNKTDEINRRLNLLGKTLEGLQAESSQHSYLLRQLHKDLVQLIDTVRMAPHSTIQDPSSLPLCGVIGVLVVVCCVCVIYLLSGRPSRIK